MNNGKHVHKIVIEQSVTCLNLANSKASTHSFAKMINYNSTNHLSPGGLRTWIYGETLFQHPEMNIYWH